MIACRKSCHGVNEVGHGETTRQSLCSGSAFDSIAQQISQAQDIQLDGTNAAGTPCTAISIGLGFDGVQIGPVDTVSFPEGQLPNICPEAGGD